MNLFRTIALTLVASLTLQSAAQFAVLVSVRVWARTEAGRIVRDHIPSEQLHVFRMSIERDRADGRVVTWIEDHEFEFEGVMYDLVRTYDSAGCQVVHAVRDGTDTWLHAALNREQQRQQRTRTHHGPVRDLLKRVTCVISTPASSEAMNIHLPCVPVCPVELVSSPKRGFPRILEEPPSMS